MAIRNGRRTRGAESYSRPDYGPNVVGPAFVFYYCSFLTWSSALRSLKRPIGQFLTAIVFPPLAIILRSMQIDDVCREYLPGANADELQKRARRLWAFSNVPLFLVGFPLALYFERALNNDVRWYKFRFFFAWLGTLPAVLQAQLFLYLWRDYEKNLSAAVYGGYRATPKQGGLAGDETEAEETEGSEGSAQTIYGSLSGGETA